MPPNQQAYAGHQFLHMMPTRSGGGGPVKRENLATWGPHHYHHGWSGDWSQTQLRNGGSNSGCGYTTTRGWISPRLTGAYQEPRYPDTYPDPFMTQPPNIEHSAARVSYPERHFLKILKFLCA